MAKYRIPILLSIIVVLTSALLFAQRGARNYNPNTETTLKGTVQKVSETAGKRGFNGTHLEFKSGDTTYNVHVGPSAYIAKQGFTFAPGDEIEVTGSKVNMGGSEVIIARQIKKADKTLVLRNAQGIPEWSGGMQRAQ
jgi:DNA/RNA endonuclease YhcR with UshA esterase domain